MSCFPRRKKQDSWKLGLNNVMIIRQRRRTKISAQIRSVAATLYEKFDLNKPTVEFLREHFYKDLTLALAYFYCCSTYPPVAILNDELQSEVDKSVTWNHS
jgi:hypothetical protein